MKAKLMTFLASMVVTACVPVVALADDLFNQYDASGINYGVEGYMIRNDAAYVVSNPPEYTSSSSWVMSDSQLGNLEYAQVGWLRWGNLSQPYYFFEENNGTTDYQIYTNDYRAKTSDTSSGTPPTSSDLSGAVGPATGVSHDYKVEYHPATGLWDGYVDGGYYNDFYAYESNWIPDDAQFSEEIHNSGYIRYFGSSVNGASTETVFSQLALLNSSFGKYYPSLTFIGDSTDAGYSPVYNNGTSSDYFYLWDTRNS